VKHAKSSELTLIVTTNYIPCILPSMEVEGKRDQSWQGQNDPAFPPGASESGDLRTTQIGVKMGVFWKEMIAGQLEGRGTLPW
jgi:hypothetical protein